MNFDQAQSSRLGQRLAVDATIIQMYTGADLPEAPYYAQMIYRPDRQVIQIYNGDAWEDVVSGVAGMLTYVGPEAPTTGKLGDLWYDTDDGHHMYRHDGTDWESVQDGKIPELINEVGVLDGAIDTLHLDLSELESAQSQLSIDLTGLESRLNDLDTQLSETAAGVAADLAELNNVTLPALRTEFEEADAAIDQAVGTVVDRLAPGGDVYQSIYNAATNIVTGDRLADFAVTVKKFNTPQHLFF